VDENGEMTPLWADCDKLRAARLRNRAFAGATALCRVPLISNTTFARRAAERIHLLPLRGGMPALFHRHFFDAAMAVDRLLRDAGIGDYPIT